MKRQRHSRRRDADLILDPGPPRPKIAFTGDKASDAKLIEKYLEEVIDPYLADIEKRREAVGDEAIDSVVAALEANGLASLAYETGVGLLAMAEHSEAVVLPDPRVVNANHFDAIERDVWPALAAKMRNAVNNRRSATFGPGAAELGAVEEAFLDDVAQRATIAEALPWLHRAGYDEAVTKLAGIPEKHLLKLDGMIGLASETAQRLVEDRRRADERKRKPASDTYAKWCGQRLQFAYQFAKENDKNLLIGVTEKKPTSRTILTWLKSQARADSDQIRGMSRRALLAERGSGAPDNLMDILSRAQQGAGSSRDEAIEDLCAIDRAYWERFPPDPDPKRDGPLAARIESVRDKWHPDLRKTGADRFP